MSGDWTPSLDAVARRLAAEPRLELWFDVSPLFDEQWTGIPMVAAALARLLLIHLPQTRFFFETTEIKPDFVRDALVRDSGVLLPAAFQDGRANLGPVQLDPARLAIGLNPSVKRVRGVFDVECNLIHDLSTLITPQYHLGANIDHHMQVMQADLASNDVTFCVSAAVRDDLVGYLALDPADVVVAHNGVSWPERFAQQLWNEVGEATVEPYLLMLGTREPRKNVARLLECVERSPSLLEHCRLVIAGKLGWLQSAEPHPVLAAAIAERRIVFPGYVGEYEKYRLLAGARATVYPSFFEGFGLPVLESLSLGTPCVASFSSSLPEAGGPACVYFDPYSTSDLHRALRVVLDEDEAAQAARRQACRAQAAAFTWDRMLATILERLGALSFARLP